MEKDRDESLQLLCKEDNQMEMDTKGAEWKSRGAELNDRILSLERKTAALAQLQVWIDRTLIKTSKHISVSI